MIKKKSVVIFLFSVCNLYSMEQNHIQEGDFSAITKIRIANRQILPTALEREKLQDEALTNAYETIENDDYIGQYLNPIRPLYPEQKWTECANPEALAQYEKSRQREIEVLKNRKEEIYELLVDNAGKRISPKIDEDRCYQHLQYILLNGWDNYVALRLKL